MRLDFDFVFGEHHGPSADYFFTLDLPNSPPLIIRVVIPNPSSENYNNSNVFSNLISWLQRDHVQDLTPEEITYAIPRRAHLESALREAIVYYLWSNFQATD